MVIILIGILVTLSTGTLTGTVNEARFQQTVLKLRQIRNAMVGDPEIKENGSRTSFGFLGDIGAVPHMDHGPGILQLVTGGGFAPFAVDSAKRMSAGWNGPYLVTGSLGEDPTLDSWGNPIEYRHGTNPITIQSYGADGAAGGSGLNQDIVMSIPVESIRVTVSGFVCNNGGPYVGPTEVYLHYPDGAGVISTGSTVPNPATGYFSFSNIPVGVRSIVLYGNSSAAPTKTVGPSVLTIDRPNYMVPCQFVDMGS
jgi:hypothetical protein